MVFFLIVERHFAGDNVFDSDKVSLIVVMFGIWDEIARLGADFTWIVCDVVSEAGLQPLYSYRSVRFRETYYLRSGEYTYWDPAGLEQQLKAFRERAADPLTPPRLDGRLLQLA